MKVQNNHCDVRQTRRLYVRVINMLMLSRIVTNLQSRNRYPTPAVKLAFHGADTDTDTDISDAPIV